MSILEEIDILITEDFYGYQNRATKIDDKLADEVGDVAKKAYVGGKKVLKKTKMSFSQGMGKVARKLGPAGLLLSGGLLAAKHAAASK